MQSIAPAIVNGEPSNIMNGNGRPKAANGKVTNGRGRGGARSMTPNVEYVLLPSHQPLPPFHTISHTHAHAHINLIPLYVYIYIYIYMFIFYFRDKM